MVHATPPSPQVTYMQLLPIFVAEETTGTEYPPELVALASGVACIV